MTHLNPALVESCKSSTNLNEILNETSKFVEENSLKNYHCKCNAITNESGPYNHANSHIPTVEFLIKCVHLIEDLFEVPCFTSIPTKLNDLYYKIGQLHNFRNAIQNIFAPGKMMIN